MTKKKDTYDKVRIRHQDPKVAEYVAKVALKNELDMEKAVKEMRPEASAEQVKRMSQTLQESPTVQKAIEFELKNAGLDDASAKEYVKRIWGWFDLANQAQEEIWVEEDGVAKRDYKLETRRMEAAQQYAITAARILQKAFISEKVEDTTPKALRIGGYEEGVRKMMGMTEESPEEGFDA